MKVEIRFVAVAALAALSVATAPAHANDFPTRARVEFVLQCIKDNGGESLKNLYGCVCIVDHIAERMTYADFEEATTFEALRTVPGERSGVFRENERGRALGKAAQEIRTEAAIQLARSDQQDNVKDLQVAWSSPPACSAVTKVARW
jgi:hypothetical protein